MTISTLQSPRSEKKTATFKATKITLLIRFTYLQRARNRHTLAAVTLGMDSPRNIDEQNIQTALSEAFPTPRLLDLESLQKWYNEYISPFNNPISTSPILQAVAADDIHTDLLERWVSQASSSVSLDHGFCSACRQCLDDWPDLADQSTQVYSKITWPGGGTDWARYQGSAVVRHCSTLELLSGSRAGQTCEGQRAHRFRPPTLACRQCV